MINRRSVLFYAAATLGTLSTRKLDGAVSSKTKAREAMRVDSLCFDKAGFDARPLIEAGVTALVIDLFRFPRNVETAYAELQAWDATFKAPQSLFLPILKGADFADAMRQNRLGIVLDSQDPAILGPIDWSIAPDNIRTLERLHAAGLRVLQLTYTDTNGIGSGFPEPQDGGLTRFGHVLVREMNRLRMLIDASHTGERTTMDAIAASRTPLAITHAGCRAIFDSPRNKSDDLIRRLAEANGYFGVYNSTLWMTDRPTASVDTIVDHIDHAIKVGGIDLVGFGSDQLALGDPTSQAIKVQGMKGYVSGVPGFPTNGPLTHTTASDLDRSNRLEVLADALRRRGYGSRAIDKILGENFVRVFTAACG